MPSQHKHPPIAFRPPEGDRLWLLAHAQHTGLPVNRILAEALADLRAKVDREHAHHAAPVAQAAPRMP